MWKKNTTTQQHYFDLTTYTDHTSSSTVPFDLIWEKSNSRSKLCEKNGQTSGQCVDEAPLAGGWTASGDPSLCRWEVVWSLGKERTASLMIPSTSLCFPATSRSIAVFEQSRGPIVDALTGAKLSPPLVQLNHDGFIPASFSH